jgi:tRNA threonylcarbamoyladenosine biosynthesis protein TsaE
VAHTGSVDETRTLAAALADLARPGDIVVHGFGRGLGVSEPITSPTFTLARQYDGRLLLHHLDVYRLEQIDEVFDVGLPELLDEGAVTLIEWGDAILTALPADFLEVRLTFGDGDDDRVLALRVVGPTWAARNRAVRATVAPWARADGEGATPC